MVNNHTDGSSCAFSEQMISYLYDEIDRLEKIKYEAHLDSCTLCADEFSSFGLVRDSIQNWKVAEFAQLETPIFDVSLIESAESAGSIKVSRPNDGWLAQIKKIFSFNHGLATAGLAGILVCLGIGLFVLFSFYNKTQQMAVVSPEINNHDAEISSLVDDITDVKADNPAFTSAKSSPENIASPIQMRRARQTTNKSVVKISNSAGASNPDSIARRPKMANENLKKSPLIMKRKVPSLNETDDDEDETIRLADLFAELDIK